MLKNIFFITFLVLITVSTIFAEKPHDFQLNTVDGEKVSLSDYLGKGVIYISFWATWCTPCKVELADLNEIYPKYKEKGFFVFSLNMDDSSTLSKVKQYVKSKDFKFPILLDTDGKVCSMYNPQKTLPFSFLIDKDGNIYKKYQGYQKGDMKKIEEDLNNLLSK